LDKENYTEDSVLVLVLARGLQRNHFPLRRVITL